MNLKDIKIRHTDTDTDNFAPENIQQAKVNTVASDLSTAEAYFFDIEETIVKKINNADAVVGCVAWLTSGPILDALSNLKHGTSIIVQKEEFLRKDVSDTESWKSRLLERYSRLSSIPEYCYGNHERKDGWFDDAANIGVSLAARCVGFSTKEKKAIPRMHHKFLVFIRSPEDCFYTSPYAIWTGSFNMSKNATLSLENGIYIESEELARAYFNEWHNTLMISEELDWTSEEPDPSIQFNYLDSNVIP